MRTTIEIYGYIFGPESQRPKQIEAELPDLPSEEFFEGFFPEDGHATIALANGVSKRVSDFHLEGPLTQNRTISCEIIGDELHLYATGTGLETQRYSVTVKPR